MAGLACSLDEKPIPKREWPGSFVDQVICGDSIQVLTEIPDNSVDCVVTDPPYGLSNDGALAGFKGGVPVEKNWTWDQFTDEKYDEFTNNYIQQIARVLKKGRLAYVWCGDLYAGILARIGKRYGLKPKCILIAKKLNASPSWRKNNWRIVFETCLLMSKGSLCLKHFNFLGHAEMENYLDGTKPISGRDVHITECIFPVGQKETEHDCEKPFSVIFPIIEASTNPGDIVLDCFSGSGVTLVAAKVLGRHYIGIEREERWVEASRRRLSQQTLFAPEVLLASERKKERLLFDDSGDESDSDSIASDDHRTRDRQEKQHGRDSVRQPAVDCSERQVPKMGESRNNGVVGSIEAARTGGCVEVADWLTE